MVRIIAEMLRRSPETASGFVDTFRKAATMSTMESRKTDRRARRQFTEEFRTGAVRLVIDEGKTVGAVARELDLTPSALATWVKQARADRTKGKTGLTTEERADLARLRKDNRELRMEREVLTPLYVKTRVLSGLDDGLACAEVCHDALVDLSRKEAFQASDDLAFGPAIGGASGDVVAGWLVESHADDDGSIEGGVGVSVAASIEAVPASGHPGRGRDRARAAELREGGVRTNPVRVIAEEDQQLGRGVGAHTEALTEGR